MSFQTQHDRTVSSSTAGAEIHHPGLPIVLRGPTYDVVPSTELHLFNAGILTETM